MSYRNVAYKILLEEMEPLTIREITSEALEKGLFSKGAKNPMGCMATAIYRDIRRRGIQSTFIKESRGKFRLNDSINETPITSLNKDTLKSKKNIAKGLYKWKIQNQSVVAYFREDDPYEQYCPVSHLLTIFNAILVCAENNKIFTQKNIITILCNMDFSPGRPFRGKSENYKILMAIGILRFEQLITTQNNHPHKFYRSNVSCEILTEWVSNFKKM